MAEYNYQHSFKLLGAIEKIAIEHHFNDHFAINGFDFFEAYRYRMFTDIKSWRKKHINHTEDASPSLIISIRVFLLNIICLAISIIGTISLWLGRQKVLIYSPDRLSDKTKHHDFRLDEVYSFLKKNHISYKEIVHTNIDKTFLLNIFKRRRFPIYLQSITFIYQILLSLGILKRPDLRAADELPLDNIDSEDRDVARLIFRKYLAEYPASKLKVNLLKFILQFSNTQLLLAIDDPRGYNEIMVASKVCKIRNSAFQHGHFTKYHIGWLASYKTAYKSIAPDILYVWSSYWKEELKNLGGLSSSESIRIAVPEKFVQMSMLGKKKNKNEKTTILIPYETDAPKEDIKKYMKAMMACPNVRILFKIRSDMPREIQYREYGIEAGDMVTVTDSLAESIAQADMVFGVYSTFLYDMIAFSIPVGMMETSMDYGEGMIRNGIADTVGLAEVCRSIERIKSLPEEVLEERKKKVYREIKPSIAEALAELID